MKRSKCQETRLCACFRIACTPRTGVNFRPTRSFVFRLYPSKKGTSRGFSSRVLHSERTDEASINSGYVTEIRETNIHMYVCTDEKSGRDATLIYTYRDQHYAFVSLSRSNQYTCTNQTILKAARFLINEKFVYESLP